MAWAWRWASKDGASGERSRPNAPSSRPWLRHSGSAPPPRRERVAEWAVRHPGRATDRAKDSAMDSITTDFGDVLLWSFWFFIWVAAIMVWFRCLFDLFGDHTLSGWGKAGWAILLVFVPWFGALIYL